VRFFAEHPLTKKIAIATAIKLLAMTALWWTFFSEPRDRNLTPAQVGDAVLHTRSAAQPPHEEHP